MKKVVAVATMAAMVAGSFPARADTYFYRYKAGISYTPDAGYGVGNDITVDFAGALGYAFSKEIPVSTKDVVEWRRISGSYQPGLDFDARSGIFSGVATGSPTPRTAVLVGYDGAGKNIAQAAITFRFNDPVGKPQTFTAYGHTGKYLYREVPATVPVSRWDSLTILPDDFSTSGLALSGTASKSFTQAIAFRGFDYMNKEVAFASGELLVQDGPVLDNVADQIRRPDKEFDVTAGVQHAVGTVGYALVALDGKPSTLSFDPKFGRLRGYIPTFATTLRFQIRAIDQDATTGVTNEFRFTTADPDIDIAGMKDLHATVNAPYQRKLVGKDLSGPMDWEVIAGKLPEGLSLDHDTGVIEGVPVKEETQTLNISVATSGNGGYGETGSFNFHVHPETVGVSFAPKQVRIGESFTTDGPTVGANVSSPWSFALAAGAAVAPGLILDEAAAKVSGTVSTAGDASVAFQFTNGDGNSKVVTQAITAFNPLGVTYDSTATFHRRTPGASVPTLAADSVMGAASFELTAGALPPGLTLSRTSGRIEGTPSKTGTWSGIIVTVRDSSGSSKASNAFTLSVIDRPAVEVAADDAAVQRYVDNTLVLASASNAYDGVTYELSAGTLPAGLSLRADGLLVGNTTDPEGVYPGFKVRATDGEGYVGESDPFSISIVTPNALDELSSSAMSKKWTEGVAFSFVLPRPANAFGSVTYAVANLPAGAGASGDTISGTLDVGSYTMPVTITDDAGRSLETAFNLEILPPMTVTFGTSGMARSLLTSRSTAKAVQPAFFDLPRGSHATISPTVTNGIDPVIHSFAGSLPTGMVATTDAVDGTPVVEGETKAVTLNVRDAAGTSVSIPMTLQVQPRLPVEVVYAIASPAGLLNGKAVSAYPAVKNVIGSVSYEISGDLPAGVFFDEATGRIWGVASVDGRFRDIVVTATDSEGASYAGTTFPLEVGISRSGSIGLANRTVFNVRAGQPFLKQIKPTNVTSPLTFTATGTPAGVTVNPVDGTIDGTFPAEGTFDFTVSVTDDFGRTRSTVVEFGVAGALQASAPATVSFSQYSTVAQKVTVKNAIGTVRYELASGVLPDGVTLDLKSGTLQGVAEKKGSWPGIVVKATDATGASASTPAFTLAVTDRVAMTMNTAASYSVFVNLPYKVTMPVLNAIGGVTFVQTGVLPPGITFNSAKGEFSGTATALGTFSGITVVATDSKGGTVTKTFSMVVTLNSNPISLTVTDFVTKVGYPISTKQPTWSNNVGNTTIWADDLLAQNGLAINPTTGIVAGQATALLDITPNIHITDSTDRVTSKPIRIQVIPDTVINAPDIINATVNTAMTPVSVTASNTVGAATWSLTGTLPTGITFTPSTGRFAGTSTEMGTFDVVVTNTDSLGDVQSKKVRVVVANNGTPPTIALTLPTTGYTATLAATIAPTYGNKKTGDVVALAPGSAALPPGMTLGKNAAGVYVLTKAVGTAADVGVYRGVTLRVTDVDGLYSEVGPLDFVYRPATFLAYPAATFSSRADAPVSMPAPVPSAGQAIKDVSFVFSSKAAGGQKLVIDQTTGAISGSITASGTNVVTVTESYDGKTIRTFAYNVTFTRIDPAFRYGDYTAIADLAVSRNMAVTNGLAGGVYTIVGDLPSGLSLNSTTGLVSGTTTQLGSFPVKITYVDAYATISKDLTISVIEEAADGHAYWKFNLDVRDSSSGNFRTEIFEIETFSEQGKILTPLATKNLYPAIFDEDYETVEFMPFGTKVDVLLSFGKKVKLSKAEATYIAAVNNGKTSIATYTWYWSDDGLNWVRSGNVVSSAGSPTKSRFVIPLTN